MNILHLSDLHFGPATPANDWYLPLKRDLLDELDCRQLNALILSGDIANLATEAEYAHAQVFIARLADDFLLETNQIVLTPGNHDVDWTISRNAYHPVRRSEISTRRIHRIFDDDTPRYVEIVEDALLYNQRFANYAAFHKNVTGRDYALDDGQQYGIWVFPEAEVVILGLNSAYELDHLQPAIPSICTAAVNLALDELRPVDDRQRYDAYLKLAVWHHPVHSGNDDRIRDASFCEALAKQGFSIALHGHTHILDANQLSYEHNPGGRGIRLISSGTFGAPTRELPTGTPWLYNFIQIEHEQVIVHTRSRRNSMVWRPYAVWEQGQGSDPLPRYIVPISPRRHRKRHQRIMIRTMAEFDSHCWNEGYSRNGYHIAVEAHIFDSLGRVLLQVRGPSARDEVGHLEGIGGEVSAQSNDLIAELLREILEEIGQVDIAVDYLLEVRPVRFTEKDGSVRDWFVLSYLCRLLKGSPVPIDRNRVAELNFYTMDEWQSIPDETLSRSTSRARILYKAIFGCQPYYNVWRVT
jgi:hypothetical protein